MRNVHAAEHQAVSISLVMWHQVAVVEHSYAEHCGVDADTQEEDTDETHHLVERQNRGKEQEGQLRLFTSAFCKYNMPQEKRQALQVLLFFVR